MDKHNLVMGERYVVTMSDCCIEGEFTGKFMGWLPSDDGSIEKYRAQFFVGDPQGGGGMVLIGPEWSTQWSEKLLPRA